MCVLDRCQVEGDDGQCISPTEMSAFHYARVQDKQILAQPQTRPGPGMATHLSAKSAVRKMRCLSRRSRSRTSNVFAGRLRFQTHTRTRNSISTRHLSLSLFNGLHPAHLLALDLLQLQHLGGHLLGMPVHAGTEQHLPGERGPWIAALADAGQVQLRVLLHGHEKIAGIQAPGVDQQIGGFGTI